MFSCGQFDKSLKCFTFHLLDTHLFLRFTQMLLEEHSQQSLIKAIAITIHCNSNITVHYL